MGMFNARDIEAAAQRIEPHIVRTPLFLSTPMSQRHGAELLIKAENQQRTGSFKVRGSANFVHALQPEVAARGVVTASSGNHGIGVATAAASRQISSKIFLPSNVSPAKLTQISQLGADPILVESTDAIDCENAARQLSVAEGLQYISPYNDPLVAAGQGTIGKEILEDADGALDALVVAVGGGGLISGIATWVKTYSPSITIVGASALNDRAMAASVAAGSVIIPKFEPTFSDGTAGAIEPDTITFPICQQLVDEWIDVTELEIAQAVAAMQNDHQQAVEGSAGVGLAAAFKRAEQEPGSRIAVVSCGGNVSSGTLAAMAEMARM